MIPYTLPVGAIASIQGFLVNDTFGERLWVDPAGSGADANWQRWNTISRLYKRSLGMFTVDVRNLPGAPADTSLVLPPTVVKLQEGPPIEDVMLVRDEVANMVWGIENTVPVATGDSKRGLEAARQFRAFLQAGLDASPPLPIPAKAPIRYQVMSTVPENWIPFIPVHVDGSNREIQLQRAAMPRILLGDPNPPVSVEPRTALLRPGLDQSPSQPYFVFEEEVPRSGARLIQSFARTRWIDGRVYTWLRVRRRTGRGEGSSGLRFDELVDIPGG